MATKHKFSANGVALETAISSPDLRAICAKAAAESGPYRLVEKRSSDRQILYSLQGAFRGLVDLMTFSVTLGQVGGRNTLITEIETFTTSQTTVMLIPVTSKKMVGHDTYMQFAKKVATSVRGMDPSAQVAVSEGEDARPALPAAAAAAPASAAGCPNCGQPIRPGTESCGECGFRLYAATGVAPSAAGPAAPTTPPPTAAAPLLPPPPPPPPASSAPPPYIAPAAAAPLAPAPTAPPQPPPAAAPSNPFLIVSPFADAPSAAAPVAAPPFVPAPVTPDRAQAAEDDDVDRTQMSPRRRSEGALTVVLEDGQRIPLRGAILIGREPSERSEWPDARLVTVPDATKSVSKTHALLEVDPSGLWITDLASTNGVYVEQPDGPELDLEPGIRTAVAPGSDVSLGQYLFTVEKG